jgi:hypothetical protein
MQVVLHAGAHMTDENRLVKCLAANRDRLEQIGTNVPDPASYHKLIRDTLHAARKGGVAPDAREVLLDAIVEDGSADRLVLSNEGFFGTPKMAASGGVLYSAAEERLGTLHQIFRHDDVELFMAIRNPATFLPAVFQKTRVDTMADFLDGTDPTEVRWSNLVTRMKSAFPDMPITLWCNEDTPLIWAEILREMGGLDPAAPIEQEFALLSEIMTEAGMKRFMNYMDAHPGMTETQKRRVIAAFLDKFADESAIEEELDVPGWSDDLIARLSEIYDEDVDALQRWPGLTMIGP